MSSDPENQTMHTVVEFAGLTRFCYSPYTAALVLWLLGDNARKRVSTKEILDAALNYPWDKVKEGYFERLLEREASVSEKVDDPPIMQKHRLEDALIETEAILRRFALRDSGIDPGEITEAFQSHPKYVRASAGLQMLKPRVKELNSTLLASCPRCGLIGGIESWFGFRVIGGKRIQQSWCRVCRTTGGSSPPLEKVLSLFDADSWFALSRWGKETGELNGWERKFAYSMGVAFARDRPLSEKQQRVAERLVTKALDLGFEPKRD